MHSNCYLFFCLLTQNIFLSKICWAALSCGVGSKKKSATNFWTSADYRSKKWEMTGNRIVEGANTGSCVVFSSKFRKSSIISYKGLMSISGNNLLIDRESSGIWYNVICEIESSATAPYCPDNFLLMGEMCYHVSFCVMNYGDGWNYCKVNFGGKTGRLLSDMDCEKKPYVYEILNKYKGGNSLCGQCCPPDVKRTCFEPSSLKYPTASANCSESYDDCKTCCEKVLDCEVNWNAWGECSQTCDEGTQRRNYTVYIPPMNEGAPCPPKIETQSCIESICPDVDCTISWNEWGSCSTSCDPGIHSRTYTIVIPKEKQGSPCPPSPGYGNCSVGDCPVYDSEGCYKNQWKDNSFIQTNCIKIDQMWTDKCAMKCGKCAPAFATVAQYCCCDWSLEELTVSEQKAIGPLAIVFCNKKCEGDNSEYCGSKDQTYPWISVYSQPKVDNPCSCFTCYNNGTCINGTSCDTNGTCTIDYTVSCKCATGWSGRNCEIDIDECISNPCARGTCTATGDIPPNMWNCTCPAGWTGVDCNDDVDECSSGPCLHNATCTDYTNDYTCTCTPQFTGIHCENTNECFQNLCVNGATCVDGDNNYTCICVPGYTGRYCEIDINECVEFEIKCSFGSCLDLINEWSCKCDDGYNGTYCDTEIKECESQPCQYGATCNDLIAQYTCDCVPGYNGTNCETEINECDSSPCQNGATCINKINKYKCKCVVGYNSTNCENEIKECESNPCQNNATCHDHIGSYSCECISGTNGTNCEINPDECLSFPCKHNATCYNHFNKYYCQCVPEYTDVNCDMLTSLWLLMEEFQDALNLEELLKDILTASSTIVDAIPFVVAGMNQSDRLKLSWNYSDVFEYCKFEGETCNLLKDIQMWDEPAMGNCFTFNYENRSEHFKILRAGTQYGLDVWLNIHQEQYMPWTDIAGFKIFIHNQSEQVFAESLSYYAPGGAHVNLGLRYTEFKKLPPPYSDCISEKNSVKYYYYYGLEYTKEACIRSCFQEELRKDCKCADPRYAKPPDLPSCTLDQRACVNKFLETKGDPTLWPNCVCPTSCEFGEYDVTVTKAKYRAEALDCLPENAENEMEHFGCLENTKRNKVRVTVYFRNNDYVLYEEVPQIEFFDMLGNVGGQMGILVGMSVISIIEIFCAVIRIIVAVLTNKG